MSFEDLIRATASRMTRAELEEEFVESWRPAVGSVDPELVEDFKKQYPAPPERSENVSEPEEKPKTPWSKPPVGEHKNVELSADVFKKLSKYAAKRGLMVNKTPSQALDALFAEFRVEETS